MKTKMFVNVLYYCSFGKVSYEQEGEIKCINAEFYRDDFGWLFPHERTLEYQKKIALIEIDDFIKNARKINPVFRLASKNNLDITIYLDFISCEDAIQHHILTYAYFYKTNEWVPLLHHNTCWFNINDTDLEFAFDHINDAVKAHRGTITYFDVYGDDRMIPYGADYEPPKLSEDRIHTQIKYQAYAYYNNHVFHDIVSIFCYPIKFIRNDNGWVFPHKESLDYYKQQSKMFTGGIFSRAKHLNWRFRFIPKDKIEIVRYLDFISFDKEGAILRYVNFNDDEEYIPFLIYNEVWFMVDDEQFKYPYENLKDIMKVYKGETTHKDLYSILYTDKSLIN